jgi:hypothetical protein
MLIVNTNVWLVIMYRLRCYAALFEVVLASYNKLGSRVNTSHRTCQCHQVPGYMLFRCTKLTPRMQVTHLYMHFAAIKAQRLM